MAAVELLENNGAIVYTGAGWSNTVDANASSGSFQVDQTVNDYATVTGAMRACYVNMSPTLADGYFNVSVDGGAVTNQLMGGHGKNLRQYKTLFPAQRNLDGNSHAVKLSVGVNAFNCTLDSVFLVTGNKITLTTGNVFHIGDSIALGQGAWNAQNGYARQACCQLQAILGRPLTLTNSMSVTGQQLVGFSGAGAAKGCSLQIAQAIVAGTFNPEFLFIGPFGTNDLTGFNSFNGGVDLYLRNLYNLLCFVEDTIDTSSVTVVVSTPPFCGPTITYSHMMAGGSPSTLNLTTGTRQYESGVVGCANIVRMFPRMKLANVYGAMNRRIDLLYPSNTNDYAHPNDMGHAVIANELISAALGNSTEVGSVINVGGGRGGF